MLQDLQFKVNREKWGLLVKLREWDSPVIELAARTGYSKGYISRVLSGQIAISEDFMLKIIQVAGADLKHPKEWACLFDIVRIEKKDTFQKSNYLKFDGKVAYCKNTVFGVVRVKDRAKSLERLSDPEPIPAIDFYDDAMPKKCQTHYKYKR